MLCTEAENSASAVQSMKLLQELLLMTENDGHKIFCTSRGFSAALYLAPNTPLYKAGYRPAIAASPATVA